MIDLVFVFISFGFLYLFRIAIQKRLMGVILLMGGSQRMSIILYSLIFLPGVIIHELAHFFMASLLGVRTGEIHIFPRTGSADLEGNRVALGSVALAKTDFLRSSLIGLAPLCVGVILLYASTQILFEPVIAAPDMIASIGVLYSQLVSWWRIETGVWMYGVLAISNTMFMSKEDMKGIPVLAVVIGLLGMMLFVSGRFQLVMALSVAQILGKAARALTTSLVFVLVIDFMVAGSLYGLELILEKITGKRIHYGR